MLELTLTQIVRDDRSLNISTKPYTPWLSRRKSVTLLSSVEVQVLAQQSERLPVAAKAPRSEPRLAEVREPEGS
jgi:hypothetical protein